MTTPDGRRIPDGKDRRVPSEHGEHAHPAPEQGEQGIAGERGDSGDRGITGERGMKGDHGQHGEKGEQGEAGESGTYLHRTQALALAAFIVLAFLVLAYRTEYNTGTIQRNQMQSCQTARDVVQKYNGLLDANIVIERNNKFIDDDVRSKRVAAYTAAHFNVPVCEDIK